MSGLELVGTIVLAYGWLLLPAVWFSVAALLKYLRGRARRRDHDVRIK